MEGRIWSEMKIISYSIVFEKDKAIVELNDCVDELTEDEKEQLASEILSEIYDKWKGEYGRK